MAQTKEEITRETTEEIKKMIKEEADWYKKMAQDYGASGQPLNLAKVSGFMERAYALYEMADRL